jgi:hypothetical protein
MDLGFKRPRQKFKLLGHPFIKICKNWYEPKAIKLKTFCWGRKADGAACLKMHQVSLLPY